MLLKRITIHDGLGHVFVGDVAFENGCITAVAPKLDGEGEDMTGCHLMPGFIDPHTAWGINGTGTEIKPSSRDNDERSDPVTPELDVVYAVNGRAMSLQQLYAFGITAVAVAPTENNIYGGTIGAFTTSGVNPFCMCLKERLGMKASVSKDVKRTYGANGKSPMTRMRVYQTFASMLQKAAEYDPSKEGTARDDKLAALRPVITGALPLFVAADSAQERALIMEILKGYPQIKVVFTSTDGMDERDLTLDTSRVSMIDGFAGMDCDPRCIHRRYDLVQNLLDKGMAIGLSGTNHGSGRQSLLWEAMELCRQLQDEERVLSLMTYGNAAILGLQDLTGSIEIGKRADLVIWSAHPLKDFRGKVLRTYIAGECVYQEGDAMRCYI